MGELSSSVHTLLGPEKLNPGSNSALLCIDSNGAVPEVGGRAAWEAMASHTLKLNWGKSPMVLSFPSTPQHAVFRGTHFLPLCLLSKSLCMRSSRCAFHFPCILCSLPRPWSKVGEMLIFTTEDSL